MFRTTSNRTCPVIPFVNDRDDVSIRVGGLRREFGAVTALDGIDLDIEGPQIVGIAGPNGSGKTTLIQCLLGLLRPSGGDVRVNGTDPMQYSKDDRERLGYMPQHESVYRELTVRQNVDFFARLYRVADRMEAIEHALEFVDLRDREDAKIDELSGGMIRRTSLACALVHEPDVVFLDEPTVGLDPQVRESMWDGFREHRDDGALALVSTHYLGEARHCDRVLFLRNGRVLALDTPENLMRGADTDLEDAFLELLGDEARTTDESVDSMERGEP